jgi:periplasmic copper chaperone A
MVSSVAGRGRKAVALRAVGGSVTSRLATRPVAALRGLAGAGLLVGGLAIAGCAAPAQAGQQIDLVSPQVTVPDSAGTTDAYLTIQNNGSSDKLIGASLSTGGTVELRGPSGSGALLMRTVSSIAIPARTTVRLDPNGFHLLVIDSGPMKAGTEIQLTLTFAREGKVSALAMVTNPQTGGSSYFLN